jgi:predicted DNA binding protein
MGVITSVSVPGTQFELGRILEECDTAHAWFEQIVPTAERTFPSVWIEVPDHEVFRRCAHRSPAVESFEMTHQERLRARYHIEWDWSTDGFLAQLRDADVTVLRAVGTARRWQFELRFQSHDDVSRFQAQCLAAKLSPSFDRIVRGSTRGQAGDDLTATQRRTIELALQNGYFDVPRQTTIVELAEELGISDQAVSARIRRGMKTLARNALLHSMPDGEDRDRVQISEA